MKGSRGFWLTGLGLLTAAGGIATLLYLRGSWIPFEPDAKRYPVRGIDVSHHQGAIDWAKLSGARIRFVYLKASEGRDWTDPVFATNLAAAPTRGIALGAYHYFTLCAKGGAQAENFLNAIARRRLTLPPAVDVEYVGNCAARPPRSVFAHELLVFMAAVRRRTGHAPVLYTTQSFFEDYLSGPEFADATFWVRNLIGEATWSKGRRVMFRQFADHARIAGVGGPVDVDVFMGTEKDFAAP